MIVQTMAINHPGRIRSVTSIMSTTGNQALSASAPEALAALMAPPAEDREARIAQSIATQRTIGSPGFPFDEARTLKKTILAYDRCYYPQGVARQIAAIVAQGDRSQGLQQVDVPALIIHGKADPLIPMDGGVDTHDKIRGSKLMLIDGMGHDLPPQVWDEIVPAIAAVSRRAN
jgi:pimeloyl-ACP methyl ester carboxylesterase